MAADLLVTDDQRCPSAATPRPHPRTRTWVVAVVAGVLLVAGLGYLTGNEIQADTQFDQAHASLRTTQHHIAVAVGDLASVRAQLTLVRGQVVQSETALTRDTTQLKGAQTALASAQADVSHQTQTISDLQACLSGVEQALNALAVGDQARAIGTLNSVSASCAAAIDADG